MCPRDSHIVRVMVRKDLFHHEKVQNMLLVTVRCTRVRRGQKMERILQKETKFHGTARLGSVVKTTSTNPQDLQAKLYLYGDSYEIMTVEPRIYSVNGHLSSALHHLNTANITPKCIVNTFSYRRQIHSFSRAPLSTF